ncbi:MAG: ABC transporter permease [Ignavibacteriales bacterium]
MRLGSYILRRLAYSILVLLCLSVLIFLISRLLPGDPARMALGPRTPEWAVENLRKQLHLDRPLPVQYGLWLCSIARGDLGTSLVTRRPVTEDLRDFLPATMEMVAVAAIVEVVGGILLGVIAARYSRTWFDGVTRIIAYLGVVTPAFVWSIIFMLLFGYVWPIFPTTGRITEGLAAPATLTGMIVLDSVLAGNWKAALDCLMHLILPAVSLSMYGVAQGARITRSSMTDNMNRDFVYAEIAAGIPTRVIMMKYILKPSLIPTVSVMALDTAAMVVNAFLVEVIFNYPGLSRYGLSAMLNKDLNAIVAVIMVLGLIFVIVNIVVDFIVAYLDPRISLSGRA